MTTYRDRHKAGLYDPQKREAAEAKAAADKKTASSSAAQKNT